MSPINKSLSRYTSDWSARIEFLKKSLETESQYRDPARFERYPGENGKSAAEADSQKKAEIAATVSKLEETNLILAEQLKRFQEASAHEIRQISRRFDELESFVKAKEIDLQNLKSDAVEFRLVHKEINEKAAAQEKKWASFREEIDRKVQDLHQLISSLKMEITVEKNSPAETQKKMEEVAFKRQEEPVVDSQAPIVFLTEEKPVLKRWFEWWNEPVTRVTIPKKESD